MAKTTKSKTIDMGALHLKNGASASYSVSDGRGNMVNKKVTVLARVPAGQDMYTIANRLPKKIVGELSSTAISRIGEQRSDRNRYLVFWEKKSKLACPPAVILNKGNI